MSAFCSSIVSGSIATLRILRDGAGSSFCLWDVREDSITEHDRRYDLVYKHIIASDPAKEREVAAALRPILESFIRVAHPTDFTPGALLGPFISICTQRVSTSDAILSSADITELTALLDYSNRFHHDTNQAWQTATINDTELLDFAKRTLKFIRRS
jgi:wobble nucleotide-excising tRNase